MKRSKCLEEQIAYGFRQTESGIPMSDVYQPLGVAESPLRPRKEVCPPGRE